MPPATLCEVLGGALSGGQTTHQESLQTSVDAIFNCMTTVILRPDAFDAPGQPEGADGGLYRMV